MKGVFFSAISYLIIRIALSYVHIKSITINLLISFIVFFFIEGYFEANHI